MMTPSKWQDGKIELRERKKLPAVYELRYRVYTLGRKPEYKREVLGTVKELPTKKALMEKVKEVRERINASPAGVFFEDLVRRYKTDHIEAKLRPGSQSSALGQLWHLEQHFNGRRLADITPGELDSIINSLKARENPTQDLAKATRQHVKALAHHLWRQAILWGYLNAVVNPVSIARVTEGARPKSRSKVYVSPEIYAALLADKKLPVVTKVLIQVAYYTGMGISEILGLRWEDVSFRDLVIRVRRSVVGKNIHRTKNAFREADLPLHADLAAVLKKWKADEEIHGGWIFGSPLTNRPYHEMTMQQKHLRPAGQRLGIESLGWHAFRHGFSADLELADIPERVQMAMMRHANFAMTAHYGKDSPALFDKVRKVQNRVASMRKKSMKIA